METLVTFCAQIYALHYFTECAQTATAVPSTISVHNSKLQKGKVIHIHSNSAHKGKYVQLHPFLTSADGDKWSASRPSRLISRKESALPGGWTPGSVRAFWRMYKSFASEEIWTPHCPARCLGTRNCCWDKVNSSVNAQYIVSGVGLLFGLPGFAFQFGE